MFDVSRLDLSHLDVGKYGRQGRLFSSNLGLVFNIRWHQSVKVPARTVGGWDEQYVERVHPVRQVMVGRVRPLH